jgi:hypothetical protein
MGSKITIDDHRAREFRCAEQILLVSGENLFPDPRASAILVFPPGTFQERS